MNCDVGETTEGLENELRQMGLRMRWDVGEVTERLENELCYMGDSPGELSEELVT